MDKNDKSCDQQRVSSWEFTSAMTLTQMGVPCLPPRYVVPPSERPTKLRPKPPLPPTCTLPVVDLSSQFILADIRSACHDIGYFQVINHGIPPSVMKDAVDGATSFFNLPTEEKMQMLSADLRKQNETENGSQVMAVNCYPACPEPDLALGMPPHSDYGSLTIILQNDPGLQLLNRDGNWLSVPFIEGALIVQLGDQMEVLSNGRYKSVVHRATVRSNKLRISIASLHSLSIEKKVRPAAELVDEDHPDSYKPFSFNDFIDFISTKDSIANARFIDTSYQN